MTINCHICVIFWVCTGILTINCCVHVKGLSCVWVSLPWYQHLPCIWVGLPCVWVEGLPCIWVEGLPCIGSVSPVSGLSGLTFIPVSSPCGNGTMVALPHRCVRQSCFFDASLVFHHGALEGLLIAEWMTGHAARHVSGSLGQGPSAQFYWLRLLLMRWCCAL